MVVVRPVVDPAFRPQHLSRAGMHTERRQIAKVAYPSGLTMC